MMNEKGRLSAWTGSIGAWGALLLVGMFLLGCGSGGGGGAGADAAIEPVMVPVKFMEEGKTGSTKAIFASISGSGVSSGWLENVSGKIVDSDLSLNNLNGKYERFNVPEGGFIDGQYILKYTVGGETKEYKPSPLTWTSIPEFQTRPNLSWDAQTHYLTVTAQALSGSRVRYFLRLYNDDSRYLIRETTPTEGLQIREYVSSGGNYRIMVIADVYNGSGLSSKAVFWSQAMALD